MSEQDFTFRSMGSDVRLLVAEPRRPGLLGACEAAAAQQGYVEDFAARLSRFRPDSELCALNADPRSVVPASGLLCVAARSGVLAATSSGGLVDFTLTGALEKAGYDHSLDGARSASLAEALAEAPARRPARPHPGALWRQVKVSRSAGTIARPPGVVLDTGGTGKGLCADAVAHRLRDYPRFVVDCGGDLAVGGADSRRDPYRIEIEHPLTAERVETVELRSGGIATSGLNVRIWRRADGGFAHHLLDPSTGEPAWTGLIGATAVGDSALEAEILAKAALLSGPRGARRVLARHGGLVVHDDGDVEVIGPLRSHKLVRVRLEAA